MSDVTTQPKTTPARRRPGRHNAKPHGQKAYASENDASINDVSYAPRYHGTPQTPDKSAAISGSPGPAAASSNSTQSASKQRNKNKAKAKNPPASPESGHPGRQATPDRAAVRPNTAAAYAGATFHASPAPSALPMPSFLSKTSSESPIRHATNIAQEPSPPATDSDVPTPFRPSSVPRPQESPLDFMFRAHREEREQQRRGSSVEQRPHVLGTASPSQSPFESNSARAASMPHQRRPDPSRSASGIDTAELDGTPGQPIGPAFSTPYQERIKAARTSTARTTPNHTPSRPQREEMPQDPTEALKKFLFRPGGGSPAGSGPAMASSAPTAMPGHNAPSPARVDSAGQGRPDNLQAMENDLRRILKMDIGPSSTNSERRVFSQ